MSTGTPPSKLVTQQILTSAEALRWEFGEDFHERLTEAIYTDAAQKADRAVTRPDTPSQVHPAVWPLRTRERTISSVVGMRQMLCGSDIRVVPSVLR